MRLRILGAVLGASALLGFIALPLAEAGKTETTRYKGSFLGEPGTVSLEVKSKNGRPRTAIFVARGFELTCQDGSTEFWSSLTLRARFGREGRFEGDIWEINSVGSSEFFQVKGEVRKRRASGNLLVLLDREDDFPPDCHSYGSRGPWVAHRVGVQSRTRRVARLTAAGESRNRSRQVAQRCPTRRPPL
jgi:hypothetical protein